MRSIPETSSHSYRSVFVFAEPGKKKASKRWVSIQDRTLKAFKLQRPPKKASDVADGKETLLVQLETARVSFPQETPDAIVISSSAGTFILATLFVPTSEAHDAAAWRQALKSVAAPKAVLHNTQSFTLPTGIRALSALHSRPNELVCLSVKDEVFVRETDRGSQTRFMPLRDFIDSKSEKQCRWEDSKFGGHALTILDHSLWAGVGSRLVVVDVGIWEVAAVFADHQAPIIDIVPVLPALEMWCLDASGTVSRWPLILEEDEAHERGGGGGIISLGGAEHKITSLCTVGSDVWAGTSTGAILIFSQSSKKVTKALEKRHQAPVEAMCSWHHTMWCSDKAGRVTTWS